MLHDLLAFGEHFIVLLFHFAEVLVGRENFSQLGYLFTQLFVLVYEAFEFCFLHLLFAQNWLTIKEHLLFITVLEGAIFEEYFAQTHI